jgi:hypothetical protein
MMSTSGPPVRLLSPPREILPQHSRKSNSSVDSRSSYFSSVSSHAAASRRNSPSEGPLTPSLLSAGLAPPSCNSDRGSNHSAESNYLTPPQSPGDDEKPPYKARSQSSASLNMSTGRVDHTAREGHIHRAKKRYPKHKSRPLLERSKEHEQVSREHGRHSQQCLPGRKEKSSVNAEPDEACGRLGTFAKSIRGLKNTIQGPAEDFEDCSSQFTSTTAANITTRRWSSVRIGADELPGRGSIRADPPSNGLATGGCKRSNSWTYAPNNDEIMRVVRARLTFREVPSNHLPTPATITLRRASGISTENSVGPSTKSDVDISASLLPRPRKWNEIRRLPSTYLITTDDIDFITNLIQSGFDVRRTTVDLLDRNGAAPRKPSVTSQGVLPQSSIPADLATTIADVYEAPNIPHISLKDSRRSVSKQVSGSARKLSRALSIKKLPEIIWEDTRSTGSLSTSSKASSSSGGRAEVMDDSSGGWLLRQSSSKCPQASSPHAESPAEHRRKSSDCGDNSPTSRVFQWMFKEPKEEIVKALGPFPKHTVPDENPESPTVPGKRNSFSSISLFRPDVVSFPPLPARKFTSDWISPLPDIIAPASDDGKCLYDAGIDAQVGSGAKDPTASLLHVGEQSIPVETTGQHRSSPSPDSESCMRRKSANILHLQVSPRLGDPFKVGNALGCSSGARRKSSTQAVRLKINDERMEHHFHEDQTSWVKPPKDSGWPAPKSPFPEEFDSRKSSHALPPPFMPGHGQFNNVKIKHENRFDLIKSLTPLLPEVDHAGICGAFTGTQTRTTN